MKMKTTFVIPFCVVAAGIFHNVLSDGHSDQHLRELGRYQSETATTIGNLNRLRDSASSYLVDKLRNVGVIHSYNVGENEFKMDKAKAAGHGRADGCYASATATVDSVKERAISQSHVCDEKTWQSMDSVFTWTLHTISIGSRLSELLAEIRGVCSTTSDIESCIASKVPDLSRDLEKFKTDSNTIQNIMNIETNKAETIAKDCVSGVLSMLRTQVELARKNAKDCTSTP